MWPGDTLEDWQNWAVDKAAEHPELIETLSPLYPKVPNVAPE